MISVWFRLESHTLTKDLQSFHLLLIRITRL